MIDFEAINRAALLNGRTLVQELIPNGKFRGLEYLTCNPRRNDRTPGSFSINYRTGIWKDFASGDAGRDLVALLAYIRGRTQGDAARELAEKLGVPLLKPDGDAATSSAQKHYAKSSIRTDAPKIYPGSEEGPGRFAREVRRHVYRADGKAVRIKVKFESGKYANVYRVDAGWQAKKPENFKPVPYVTSAIDPFDIELKDDQVFWVEGEKDADSLSKVNLPGFTFGGVGDGLPDGIEGYLSKRHLVILVDNDDAGRKHGEKKAALAHSAGAASVSIIGFPELPAKADVSDYFAGGGTADELLKRVDAAALWTSDEHPSRDEAKSEAIETPSRGWRAKVVMADVLQRMTFPPVRHILPGYITEGQRSSPVNQRSANHGSPSIFVWRPQLTASPSERSSPRRRRPLFGP
jgi:putative DNA primase/helicase